MSPARKLFRISSTPNQTGQGIIEVVVVLALAAILILTLVALSVRSNRAANFAKAEDQAARLAQEGVEVIQDIRNNKPGNVLDDTGAPDNWNWIFNQNFLGSREAYFNNCGADQCLDFSPQPVVPINLPSDSRNFTRRIFVFDDPGGCNEDFTDWDRIKQFRVEVTWTDTSGDHTITTSSCLRR